jgi:hypothetical protein
MAPHAKLKLRYNFEDSYPGTWQPQGVGAQASAYRRGWYPQLPSLNGAAKAFVRVKKWLYVGGAFTTVGGAAIPYLFRMNLEDGVVDTSFNLSLSAEVAGLATDGTSLYAAGSFVDVGSISGMSYFIKLDAHGNLVQDWLVTANALGTAVAVKTGGNAVYLAGGFTVAGGESRDKVAEVSSSTGFASAWDAGGFGVFSNVNALAYNLSENMLYMGGTFTSVNGTARNNIAKLDGDTGALESWDPDSDGTVYSIAVDYPLVYVGGAFANIGGSARAFLACINQAAAATSFDPSPADDVRGISLDTVKDRVFYAGDFSGGAAAVGMDGTALPWTPGFDAACNSILFYKSTAFVGGSFADFNGIGATTVTQGGAGSVPFPLFRDDNTVFVSNATGLYNDQGDGTYALPKKSLAGCLRTTPTLESQTAGAALTETGFVPLQWEGWAKPFQSNYMAGPFSDNDYLSIPSTFGSAWQSSNELTLQFAVWIESLAAINTIWDWQNATGDVVVSVATTGAVNFNIHGTTATSAAGVIQEKQWSVITVEKSTTGDTKRVWVAQAGRASVLVIDTTQSATFGANTSNRIGRDRANAGRSLQGFVCNAFLYTSAVASSASALPFTWRDKDVSGAGLYAFQTVPFIEGNVDFKYLCILDSETYEDALNLNSAGFSIYANDGCAPVMSPRIGAKPGTFGARPGRELTFGTAATAAFLSKTGNDSTGTLGDSTLPYLTVQAAITATIGGGGAQVQILDSGVYTENIDGSGGEVVIGAAEGETPTIRQSGSGTFITGPFYFLGLIISGNREASGASRTYAPGALSSPSGELWWQDCTFENVYLTLAGADQVYRLENCSLSGYISGTGGGVSFTGTGTATVRNCYFGNDAVINMNGGRSWVERCTVRTATGAAGYAFRGCLATANDTAEKTTYMLYCLAETNGGSQKAFWMGGGYTGASSDNKVYNVYGCKAVCNAAGLGFLYQATGTAVLNEDITTVGGTDRNFLRNFSSFASCYVEATVSSVTAFDTICLSYNPIGSPAANPWMAITNCASSGATYGAFTRVSVSTGGTVTGTISKVKNFSAPDAETYGFWSFDQDAGYQFTGLASNILFASSAQTASFSTGTAVTSLTGSAMSTTGPNFLAAASGSVNAALSALSPCLFNGDTSGITDQGINWAWACNQVADAVFNGLTFSGPINMGAGLENVSGVATRAEFLTLAGLGVAGILGRDGMTIEACDGDGTNGPAFRIGGVSSSVSRSIAHGCAGAGFVYGAPDLQAANNSTWGCEYGHYDASGAVGSMSNEVHANNGVDAQVNEAVAYSAVGSVGDDVVVNATSTRLDPLYRSPYTGDLRIMTLEDGYAFQSPAKGTASDGGDMGAYEAEYGSLFRDFIELDFAAYSDWTNPDSIPEEDVAVDVAEGFKPSGSMYSTAKAIKRRWTLEWGEANPMPLEQRIALKEFYANEGEVQVAFTDACEFITCAVVKSNQLINDEIGGGYTSTDVDRPIGSIVLQEL